MSVYTTIDSGELKALLGAFELGQLVTYEGITAGIENTNYFVTTTVGEFVLTIFEDTSAFELPYFLNLMAHLAERGVRSPCPMADKDGCYLQKIKGKPEMIETIAIAGIASGVDGIFLETHPKPNKAKSDGSNMLPLDKLNWFI